MRVCVCVLVIAVLAPAPAAAATTPRAWPGLTIGYRDLTSTHGYHAAVAQAADAWNRLGLGVRFVPAPKGASSVQIVYVPGRCLSGFAGRAPTGFQRFGSRVVVRSCPAVVRPLLVAHELGRVLGLGNDDRTCSLMNSKGTSDGRTFALPAQCSRWSPPAWISSLVDPRAADVARQLYLSPARPENVTLTSGTHPRIDWRQPQGADALRTLVMRTSDRCPTRTDVAAGTAATIYAKRGYAGRHWAIDTTLPATTGRYCYRVFNVSDTGRPTPSPTLIYVTSAGPAAAATVTSPAVAGAPTVFADQSTDAGATIVHWHWDFGDPTSGASNVLDTADPIAGRTASHVYVAPGTYVVTLDVTDGLGRTATTAISFVVTAAGGPS